MQPITVAVGLTVTILALTALLVGPHVGVTSPRTPASWSPSPGRSSPCTARSAVVTLIVAIYATARALGLADLGRKVDLVERSIRRGAGGDPELAEQMQHQDRGEFDA